MIEINMKQAVEGYDAANFRKSSKSSQVKVPISTPRFWGEVLLASTLVYCVQKFRQCFPVKRCARFCCLQGVMFVMVDVPGRALLVFT